MCFVFAHSWLISQSVIVTVVNWSTATTAVATWDGKCKEATDSLVDSCGSHDKEL